HLAQSLADAGWSGCLSILHATAAWARRRARAVPPADMSQTCSGGGVVVMKGLLSVRWHSCLVYGTSLHRDQNAARNRERLGQSLQGGVTVAASEKGASPTSAVGSVNSRSCACGGRGAHLRRRAGFGPRCDSRWHSRAEACRALRAHAGAFRHSRRSPPGS